MTNDYLVRIFNDSKKLTQANNNDLVQLYTPGTKDGLPLNGYILDFIATINISSITELPRQEFPQPLATQNEIEDKFYEDTKDVPNKQIAFYRQCANNSEPIRLFGMTLWNQRPDYQEDLIPALTRWTTAAIAPGTKIFCKMQPSASGLLAEGDEITFHLTVSEEADTSLPSEPISRGIPSLISVTTNATLALAANPYRKGAIITNKSDRNIYLSRGNTAIAGMGLDLPPNTAFEINRSNFYRGAISAIVASGSAFLQIEELE